MFSQLNPNQIKLLVKIFEYYNYENLTTKEECMDFDTMYRDVKYEEKVWEHLKKNQSFNPSILNTMTRVYPTEVELPNTKTVELLKDSMGKIPK